MKHTNDTTQTNTETQLTDTLNKVVKESIETILDEPEKYLQHQRSELLAKTFQHFMKVKEEDVALESVVKAVSNSIRNIQDGETDEIEAMLAEQAMILHSTFHFYCDKAKGAYTDIDKIGMALKAQRQYERTVRALTRLRNNKTREIEREQKKFAERTSIYQMEREPALGEEIRRRIWGNEDAGT